jgi:membrane protein DedA with SNARE-associated domain
LEHTFDLLTNYFEHFHYAGIFLALLIAGFGVPIPEDVILLAAGYMMHLSPGRLSLWLTIVVCMLGIFAGDTTIYWMGRIWGTRILRFRVFRRTLTPRRLRKIEAWFAKYGDKTVFFARFVAGIRMAAFFSAGAMRMPYWKYILVDMLAATTSPLWVILAWYLGDGIDEALIAAARLKHYILAGVFVLLLAYVLFVIIRRRRGKRGEGASGQTPKAGGRLEGRKAKVGRQEA